MHANNLINLTPHPITFHSLHYDPYTLASAGVARVSATHSQIGMAFSENAETEEFAHVPLFIGSYGEVTGLPDPAPGTIYIVSMMVCQACPNRLDLASPTKLARDSDGNIIGCEGLEVSA